MCTRAEPRAQLPAAEAELLVRKALSGVARIHGQMGLKTAVGLLRGRRDARLERAGLTQLSTFGILKKYSETFVLRLLRRCVTAGLVTFTADEHPLVALTAEGIAVMRAQAKPDLVLHDESVGNASSVHAAVSHSGTGGVGRTAVEQRLDGPGEAAFAALREHRLAVAREQGVPPYVVATDRSLRDLAMLRPRTLDALLTVHGIGPAKVQRYGQGLLDTLRQLE